MEKNKEGFCKNKQRIIGRDLGDLLVSWFVCLFVFSVETVILCILNLRTSLIGSNGNDVMEGVWWEQLLAFPSPAMADLEAPPHKPFCSVDHRSV